MIFEDFVILAAIYAVSGVVHGLVGFAFAVVSVPVISILYSPSVAVGITVVIGPLVMFYNTWVHRERLQFRRVLPLTITGLVFVPVGAVFLRQAAEAPIMITLGAAVITLTVFSDLFAKRTSAVLGLRPIGYGFSIVAGFLAGAFVTGGPPIVAYLYNSDSDKIRAKANSQLFFALFAVTALVVHMSTGVVTAERALYGLPLFPLAVVAIRLGVYLSDRLPKQAYRYVTDAGLIILGSYLIFAHV